MARALFIRDEAFAWELSAFSAEYPEIAEKALKAGAAVIAPELKANLRGVLSPKATGELVASFGITPVKQDRNFNYNVHLGFDGYQALRLKSGTRRVPFQLLARSFESGAVVGGRFEVKSDGARNRRVKKKRSAYEYWRKPTPFARPAVLKMRSEAERVMRETAEEEWRRITAEGNQHKGG